MPRQSQHGFSPTVNRRLILTLCESQQNHVRTDAEEVFLFAHAEAAETEPLRVVVTGVDARQTWLTTRLRGWFTTHHVNVP